MARGKTNGEKITQLELIPTGKSEQALNSYDFIRDHLRVQDRVYKGLYGEIYNRLKEGGLSVTEIKQLGDFMRGAGSWVKQSQDALIQAETELANAIESGREITLDLSGLSDDELLETLSQYEKKVRGC
jgi:hypothetical protein